MYYIGDLDELMDDEVEECVATCKVNLKISLFMRKWSSNLFKIFKADGGKTSKCKDECDWEEAVFEIIKAEGVNYDGLLTPGEKAARGFTYVLILIYFFMGVAIVADRFMASIEVITSQEKEVTVTS